MAGPDPYTQVKWTREQERAYAEGRKSAQAAAPGQPLRSTRRKKGVVRTAAGARKYKVPIGAEIGSARNAKAAESHKDTESTGRYEALVGGDRAAQAAAMRGLSDDQLQRLSRVAYSFKSSNPAVVQLRIGVANELKRRGFNVNDFGGLGKGSAKPTGPAPAPQGKPAPQKKGRKVAAAPKPPPRTPPRSAMQARKNDRKLRELSVPQLRKALGVFSRVPPDKRQAVARVLVRRAVELSATNLLGSAVVEAANITGPEAIELAGRWKHGWIPLDAVAMRAKMKGGNGKPWWSGGKQSRRGSAGSMRKSVEAGRQARAAREARRTPTTRPKIVNEPEAAAAAAKKKPAPFVAVPKKGGAKKPSKLRKGVVSNEQSGYQYAAVRTGGAEGSRQLRESRRTAPDRLAKGRAILDKQLDDEVAKIRAKRAAKGGSTERTSVVKSSPKPKEGSKMNTTAPAGNTKVTAAEQKMIDQMAERYAKMHGSAGARSQARKVRAKGGDMNLAMADALEKAAGTSKPRQGHPSKTIGNKADRLAELEAELDRVRRKRKGSMVARNNQISRLTDEIEKLKSGSSGKA